MPAGVRPRRRFFDQETSPTHLDDAVARVSQPQRSAAQRSCPDWLRAGMPPPGLSTLAVLPMHEVTRILSAIEHGDPHAAEQLLPLVYEELRKLAAQKLAGEKPGQTLQATALVHEAYLRLVDDGQAHPWNSKGHFFAAAAEAMRRILIEKARRKQRLRHGGGRQRLALDNLDVA